MSNSQGLRAAVIGLGRMGMNHVRACVDTPGIDLVAILDHKPDWAVQIGAETQSLVAADVESLLGKVDLAIIAVPTADHAVTAVPLLEQGIACLVEKPISITENDADAMIAAADRGKAILQVGHIERFNPAISTLHGELKDGGAVKRITARRHNPSQDRTYDVDAVLDLMIHDLELSLTLWNQEVSDLSVSSGATEHAVSAQFTIGGSVSVDLSVDRQATSPLRDMTVETEDGVYLVNFSAQGLSRQTRDGHEDIAVQQDDALRRQLKSIANAAGSGAMDGATGDDGLAALRLANQIRTLAGLA